MDPEKYRPLSQYTAVYSEFYRSLGKLRDWLFQQIAEAETK